jgi:hypothetical protein
VISTSTAAGSIALAADDLSAFGQDPWWIVVIKALGIFVLLVVLTLFNIWLERRVVARMQHRIGPNVNGPFGLLQSLADGVKLALKEDVLPKAADRVVYFLAPVLSVIPAFVAFAVIPLGPVVNMFGVQTPLQLTDMPVAVLFVLAITSIGIYGIVLGGWSSGSTYSLLGGLRSSAQMISYELAMGMSFVAVFLYAGSMSTSEIVSSQERLWSRTSISHSANSASTRTKNSESAPAAARAPRNARFLLPPPSTQRVPLAIFVSTMYSIHARATRARMFAGLFLSAASSDRLASQYSFQPVLRPKVSRCSQT